MHEVVVKKPCRFVHHFTDYQHFTLQNSSISLYKIEGFYFTYYQHFTLQIISISTINLQSGSSTTQLMVWFANPSNHQKKPQLCLGFHWIAGRGRNIRTRFFAIFRKTEQTDLRFSVLPFWWFCRIFHAWKIVWFFYLQSLPCLAAASPQGIIRLGTMWNGKPASHSGQNQLHLHCRLNHKKDLKLKQGNLFHRTKVNQIPKEQKYYRCGQVIKRIPYQRLSTVLYQRLQQPQSSRIPLNSN